MVYVNPDNMTREKRDALLEWVTAEGLDPADILNNGRFSVHNGRVAGERFVRPTGDSDKPFIVWNDHMVIKHFNVPQKNQLPEVLNEQNDRN